MNLILRRLYWNNRLVGLIAKTNEGSAMVSVFDTQDRETSDKFFIGGLGVYTRLMRQMMQKRSIDKLTIDGHQEPRRRRREQTDELELKPATTYELPAANATLTDAVLAIFGIDTGTTDRLKRIILETPDWPE